MSPVLVQHPLHFSIDCLDCYYWSLVHYLIPLISISVIWIDHWVFVQIMFKQFSSVPCFSHTPYHFSIDFLDCYYWSLIHYLISLMSFSVIWIDHWVFVQIMFKHSPVPPVLVQHPLHFSIDCLDCYYWSLVHYLIPLISFSLIWIDHWVFVQIWFKQLSSVLCISPTPTSFLHWLLGLLLLVIGPLSHTFNLFLSHLNRSLSICTNLI